MLKMMEERLATGVSIVPELHEGPTKQDISDMFSNVMVS